MTKNTDIENYERRCPRLGHPVLFDYCFKNGDNHQPCWKIADCWWEYFDVMAYLKANLPEETVNRIINTRPKPKMVSLIELIEQAKSRNQNK